MAKLVLRRAPQPRYVHIWSEEKKGGWSRIAKLDSNRLTDHGAINRNLQDYLPDGSDLQFYRRNNHLELCCLLQVNV